MGPKNKHQKNGGGGSNDNEHKADGGMNKSAGGSGGTRGGGGGGHGGSGSGAGRQYAVILPFSSLETMAAALARVSAYIEDPQHHGKVIAPDKVKEMKLVACGYAGHNFSLQIYTEACSALEPLTSAESIVAKAITLAVKSNKCLVPNVYILAYVKSDDKTLQHEKWHAIYYYTADYRKRVDGIWKMVEKGYEHWAKQFIKHLSDKYAAHVWLDEFQAIILNREYECVSKIVNLLQAAVPGKEPFVCITVDAA